MVDKYGGCKISSRATEQNVFSRTYVGRFPARCQPTLLSVYFVVSKMAIRGRLLGMSWLVVCSLWREVNNGSTLYNLFVVYGVYVKRTKALLGGFAAWSTEDQLVRCLEESIEEDYDCQWTTKIIDDRARLRRKPKPCSVI